MPFDSGSIQGGWNQVEKMCIWLYSLVFNTSNNFDVSLQLVVCQHETWLIHLQEDVTRGRIRGCLLKLDESSTLPGFFTLSNPQLGAHSTAGGQPVRREPETRKEVLRRRPRRVKQKQFRRMDAIKSKMHKLSGETAEATAKADRCFQVISTLCKWGNKYFCGVQCMVAKCDIFIATLLMCSEVESLKHCDLSRFEEEYLRATKEAEKIEAVLGGLTKKNQAQVLNSFMNWIYSL